MADALKVLVEAPAIAGDTVVFRWTQSEPNPFQRENLFSFRYDGLDLRFFSPLLFYEIFLALQLRVFAAYERRVEIVFPGPIPRPSVDYWRAFHDADDVTISPIAEVDAYSPWVAVPACRRRHGYAVFFGGGRDSTATTCLLAETYGAEEVLLVQYVAPRRPSRKLADHLSKRQEELMLRPARERLGVATQTVWTDYLAHFHGLGEALRPHYQFYTVGALPALLAEGVSLASFCIEWTQYPAFRERDGSLRFRFPRSRPETLATQSTHYRRVLGVDLTITDVNLLFSSATAFRILAERYPRALDQIVMCTLGEVDQRWCYGCNDCVRYALHSLFDGFVDPRFDYDRLFRESPHIRKIVDYAATGVERSVHGNAPPLPSLGLSLHSVFFHVIAGVDVALVADRLSPEASTNLMTVKTLFGNRTFPSVELMPTKAIDLMGHETARRVALLVAKHATAADRLPGPWANDDVVYDFGVRMPTRTALLAHIRG